MLGKALIVGLGGFLGAIARFGISNWANGKLAFFPLGTLLANILGSFLMGALLFGVFNPKLLGDEYRLLLIIGFCGSLTTMSTFAMDFFQMNQNQQMMQAVGYLILNVVGCILVIWLAKFLFS